MLWAGIFIFKLKYNILNIIFVLKSLIPVLNTVSGCFIVENMSSTSQKHRNFVSEPMGQKKVTELAGIGEALGGRLDEKGFDKAYVVLGQFLVLKMDEELFYDWLKETCNANSKQCRDCFQCLKEWCEAFL